jgi:hypothetical protein
MGWVMEAVKQAGLVELRASVLGTEAGRNDLSGNE